MNFTLAYPTWFVLICIALGLAFSFILYRNKKDNFPKPWIFYGLAALRAILVSLISFLLLSPILSYLKTKEEKPTIAFLHDNSASQKYAFAKIDSSTYHKDIQQLIQNLRADYQVKEYSMGDLLRDSLSFNYKDQSTDISSALETVMTNLENENLGAVILASDGIYNKGVSPISNNYPYKGIIYSIGIGDTAVQRDALVARVFANKMTYLGDKFAIRSDIAAYACGGKTVNVSVYSHNAKSVIASQQVVIQDGRFSKAIETIIEAKSAGIQHYTISVSQVDGEKNITNNSQDVYVEVVDSKEKVLLVANSPHPDVFAIRDALSKNKNFKVDVQTAAKMNANINDYNLLILHNLPSMNYNASSLIEQAKRMGISIWYVTGSQTAIPMFNIVQSAMQISPRGISANDIQASLNKEFSYFTINPNAQINNLPPLSSPFGEYKLGANAQILMSQKIGSVSTNYPLWVLQQNNQQRIGIVAGEGLWRWRMYDFNQHKNHNLVDEYLLKTAQYLSVKQDKQKFRLQVNKNVFSESEPISFDAELYNDNYELINTPEVNLSISKGNTRSNYTINKTENAYSLTIGNLSEGTYNYNASTTFNGKQFSSSGSLVVVAQNIEEMNTTADFGMLNQLAKNYGGEFLYPNQIQSIAEKIKNNPNIKPVLRSNVQNDLLINWKWIFGFLIALLALEWFVRKRTGNY